MRGQAAKDDPYKALKTALQKLERTIAKAHVKDARKPGPLRDRLEAQHRAAETGGKLDDYIEIVAGRSAVQFLLRTVYVRTLEDLGLLDPPRIRGQRGLDAFRKVAPPLRERAYFKWMFRDLALDFPALFVPAEDELPLPSADLCHDVWELWHKEDGKGNLVYQFSDREFDSRFLGDLYQDLDADVREKFALLQTPDFVESYILDHTLTPAIAEFDPEALHAKGEALRVLDPTCGSGHFVIGAFRRMFAYWKDRGCEPVEACKRAGENVWGCDINPYAVDIARFRLLLEVVQKTGERDLDVLAKLAEGFHLRALDSLIPWEGKMGRGAQTDLFEQNDRLKEYATEEERRANKEFLGRDFHVVVGNPPYVTPKDPKKRDDYRVFWPKSANGGYGLSAPFVERFFVLGCHGAFAGQITSNAFTKREFGASLIENVLPHLDLTDLIDTSGAFIPGHGTPTIVLFGRSRQPARDTLRVVGGKRGESKQPDMPAEGRVWKAIVSSGAEPDDHSPFVTVSRYERALFGAHPWNVNGGGAPELMRRLKGTTSSTLAEHADVIGRTSHTGQDEVYFADRLSLLRLGTPPSRIIAIVKGEPVRDWLTDAQEWSLFPYDVTTAQPVAPEARGERQHYWRFRWLLRRRVDFGRAIEERGLPWYAHSMFFPDRFLRRLGIAFAFVSTHNHFVLDLGGKVFNRTAPVIKLPERMTVRDHLAILGLLNSSTLCFWMKQVFFDRGNGGIGGGIANEAWERFYEHDSTKLQQAPISAADGEPRIALAQALHDTAQLRAACLPAAVLASSDWHPDNLRDHLAESRTRYHELTHKMVALQEELDWLTYRSYGLLLGHAVATPEDVEPLAPGHRPFEILLARHNATCPKDEHSEWFSRHGHDETTTIPDRYSAVTRDRIVERLRIIDTNPDVRLIEQPAFKRRWQLANFDEETRSATRDWLLDRLEDLFAPAEGDRPAGPLHAPKPYRLEDILAAWTAGDLGARVRAVAQAHLKTAEVDLASLAEQLLRDNGLPDNPYRLYTTEGIDKLRKWQHVWRLQDEEDAGKKVTIPEPDEFDKDDFRQPRYLQIRGKLNVPRERFIVFADLTPPHYGWNGWRDRNRALAQVDAYTLCESHPTEPLPAPTIDDPRRCGATIGLWESLPDLKRWGEPATRESEYGELLSLAKDACGGRTCPCDVVHAWEKAFEAKPISLKKRGAKSAEPSPASLKPSSDSAKPVSARPAAPEEEAPITGEERDRIVKGLQLGAAMTFAKLAQMWGGSPERLKRILDELVASGDMAVLGQGRAKRYVLSR